FKNIKYLAKGGFGTIHSATWIQGPRWKEAPVWKRVAGHYYGRCGPTQVALKTLDHSAKMTSDFLQELLRHQEMLFPHWISKIIYCFGITQDPKTQNYVLVVDYASEGDLHSYLEKNSAKITWAQKLEILGEVASALVDIHRKDLVHGDLHTGNILVGMALSHASGFGNSPTDINDKKWREYLQRITESSKQQKFSVHPDAVYSSRLLDCPVRRKVKRLMTKSVGNES
ncbi:7627_t:CDS:2, partial [Ambispora leptoticha]